MKGEGGCGGVKRGSLVHVNGRCVASRQEKRERKKRQEKRQEKEKKGGRHLLGLLTTRPCNDLPVDSRSTPCPSVTSLLAFVGDQLVTATVVIPPRMRAFPDAEWALSI